MMDNDVSQAIVLILSGSGAYLVGSNRATVRRWGFGLALLAQPIWLWSTFNPQQWGLFALSVCFTIAWARGLRKTWRGDDGR